MPAPVTLPFVPQTAGGKSVLVTGAAGFIGYHLTRRLNALGVRVVGFDNVNDYYETSLKEARLQQLFYFPMVHPNDETKADHKVVVQPYTATATIETCTANPLFVFIRGSLENAQDLQKLFSEEQFDCVVHLAAQAGVRYSITNPDSYIQSNLVGFHQMLECCRRFPVKHFVYASSSSVYGGNTKTPFSEHDGVDHPVSLYAATKKSNELIGHSYAHLFHIPMTGLRFFTVYGPYGRPDMATAIFTKAILQGKPIELFNHGQMKRDFTFVDDIVEGILRIAERPPAVPSFSAASNANESQQQQAQDPAVSATGPYRVLNIGNAHPVELLSFVETLEGALGVKTEKVLKPMQPGDVLTTAADTSLLEELTGFSPYTPLSEGLAAYVSWYRGYYGV